MFHITHNQLYLLIQLETGVDQIPRPPEVMPPDLTNDTIFEKLKPSNLPKSVVSLDQVQDFYDLAGETPVLLVNEPMLILCGISNSDVRYNSYYRVGHPTSIANILVKPLSNKGGIISIFGIDSRQVVSPIHPYISLSMANGILRQLLCPRSIKLVIKK